MQLITKNKQAYNDYEILDTYEAGIILAGHEVKSIKGNHVNIKDAIVILEESNLVLHNMDIPLYEKANINTLRGGYAPKGRRTLLVNKKELTKIVGKTTKTGLTIVPLQVYTDPRGRVKITIGIGKLKRKIDKKEAIKTRDRIREMEREIKEYK